MPVADQEELERRLLALVRDYLEHADENEVYNDGYEVRDFTIIFSIHEPPKTDAALEPWDGGASPGWAQWVAWTTTIRGDWMRQAVLEEALQMFHARGDEETDDDDDDEDGDSET